MTCDNNCLSNQSTFSFRFELKQKKKGNRTECAYDLTISTRLMQSLYYSHKSSKNGNHTLKSYFRRTKVVQYRFMQKFVLQTI